MDERKRIKPEKGEWPYVILGVFLFFGTIFLFVTEIDDFSLTTSVNLFMFVFLLLGLSLSMGLSWYFGKGTKGLERTKVTLLFVIFVTLIVPVWAHFINRMVVVYSHDENVEVFENSLHNLELNQVLIDNAIDRGFDLFLVHDKKILKVPTKRREHLHIKEGDRIDITLCRGIFGFEFVAGQKFR